MKAKVKLQWVSTFTTFILAVILSSLAGAVAADHVVIPLSNPLKPAIVKITLYSGSISVTGHSGKDVVMDVQAWEEHSRRNYRRGPAADSSELKRISSPRTALVIQEDNNIVNIGNGAANHAVDLSLQVPMKTNLVLTVNGGGNICVNQVEGDVQINNSPQRKSASRGPVYGSPTVAVKKSGPGNIELHQVKGEIEITNGRGSVILDKISGNVVAYAQNGDLRASFLHVKPGKPMSFSSMDGMIDVWLPPDLKANMTMQSTGGEINSDFEIKLDSAAVGSLAGTRNNHYARSRSVDRTIVGKINGGGQDIQIRTYKGNIFIRKFLDAARSSQSK
jgi:hypothetical protein